ncbi:remorin 1.4-like isoform X1 [Pyrus communis]|uniref:remorin 1.4-like isoform X1 n=1 Tax=Pyrus communis TaxID=23211 RepID=UPI0035BFB55B
MEVNQMRVRISGVGQEKTEESGSVYGRRIPPQKTESFKEKRKTQNWFQRRLSGQTSQDYDASNAMKHATAVGAAAFAIKSIEDSAISDKKKTGYERKPTTERIKSRKEETTISKPVSGSGRFSKIFSGTGSTKRTPEREDPHGKVPISIATTGKNPEKAVHPAPSIKKTPTFADKQSNSAGGVNPETAAPKPNLSTTTKPESPWNETRRPSSTGPGTTKTQADIWEETEIARLKERYEKINATIVAWEKKKKKKSTNHLHKIESEVERKRAKAVLKFGSEMETIKQIAEGARAKAEERHRKEVLKVKEKANAMRTTGKAPKTCFCV